MRSLPVQRPQRVQALFGGWIGSGGQLSLPHSKDPERGAIMAALTETQSRREGAFKDMTFHREENLQIGGMTAYKNLWHK